MQKKRTYVVEISIGGLVSKMKIGAETSFHAAAKLQRKYSISFPKRKVEILSCELEKTDDSTEY